MNRKLRFAEDSVPLYRQLYTSWHEPGLGVACTDTWSSTVGSKC